MNYKLLPLFVAALFVAACGPGKTYRSAPADSIAADTAIVANEAASVDTAGVHGDLGIFELRGPVRECTQRGSNGFEIKWGFDPQGRWISENDEPLSAKFPGGIERDTQGHLLRGRTDKLEELYIIFTYNSRGLVERIDYAEYLDGGSIEERTYDAQGDVVQLKTEYTGMDAIDDETGEELPPVIQTCTIQRRDAHGNWIRRKIGDVEQERHITYYQ